MRTISRASVPDKKLHLPAKLTVVDREDSMNEHSISPQQKREHPDPHELTHPVPWYLIMLVALLFAFGVVYISYANIGTPPEWGDGRVESELMPGNPAHSGAAVDAASIYASRCAACHQANGAGLPGVFPPLAGSEWVNGKAQTLGAILLHGVNGSLTVKGATYNGAMPAFKDQLGDAEIAAVATYIRSQWGNQGQAIRTESIAELRRALEARTEPLKGDAELAAMQ